MKKRIVFCAVASALVLGLTSAASAGFTDFYMFGDSLSDVGNMSIISGGTIPDPNIYWNGRLSNGPVAAEVFGLRLSPNPMVLMPLPSEAGGNGYAFDRARTSTHEAGNQYSIMGQVNSYVTLRGVDPGAMHVVWGGANNLRDALVDPGNAGTIVAGALGDLQLTLGQLVGGGAQHILVPNAPDLGLVPAVTSMGAAAMAGATHLSSQFNAGLEQILAAYDPAANIYRFDTFSWVQDAVANPGKYGFTNVTDPYIVSGTGDPDGYMFWDPIHPTRKTHEILGNLWEPVPEPATVGLLLAGVAMMAFARRRR